MGCCYSRSRYYTLDKQENNIYKSTNRNEMYMTTIRYGHAYKILKIYNQPY